MNSVTAKTFKVYVFYCSNSVDINDCKQMFVDGMFENRFISLPCSGKVNLLYFIKAFETGVDGIILLTCPKNKCTFLEGNLRAPKRADAVNSLMEEIGVGKDRVLVMRMNGGGMNEVASRVAEFYNMIRNA